MGSASTPRGRMGMRVCARVVLTNSNPNCPRVQPKGWISKAGVAIITTPPPLAWALAPWSRALWALAPWSRALGLVPWSRALVPWS